MQTSLADRCADCTRIAKLVKCSKADCDNQLCPTCADRYSGKHCNSCYASVGSVALAEWAMTGDDPPNAIGIDV